MFLSTMFLFPSPWAASGRARSSPPRSDAPPLCGGHGNRPPAGRCCACCCCPRCHYCNPHGCMQEEEGEAGAPSSPCEALPWSWLGRLELLEPDQYRGGQNGCFPGKAVFLRCDPTYTMRMLYVYLIDRHLELLPCSAMCSPPPPCVSWPPPATQSWLSAPPAQQPVNKTEFNEDMLFSAK